MAIGIDFGRSLGFDPNFLMILITLILIGSFILFFLTKLKENL